MRFRSSLSLILALATIGTITACNDATAPDPLEEVSLPPFEQQKVTIYLMSDGDSYGGYNHLRLYTPIGVDPIFDLTVENLSASSPKIESVIYRSPDQSTVCTSNCTKTPWTIYTEHKAGAVGLARVTLSLRSRPSEKTSYLVEVVKAPDDN